MTDQYGHHGLNNWRELSRIDRAIQDAMRHQISELVNRETYEQAEARNAARIAREIETLNNRLAKPGHPNNPRRLRRERTLARLLR